MTGHTPKGVWVSERISPGGGLFENAVTTYWYKSKPVTVMPKKLQLHKNIVPVLRTVSKKLNYDIWTKDQLVEEISRLRRRKKYGLVWEEKPEDVVEQCKKELPILKEVSKYAIKNSKDAPTNIIIEGDNYHALSVLNYTHKGKIDVIYIDPPYNTGNASWRYNNKIIDAEDAFRHSKFASFIQHRLKMAKSLLSPTGILVFTIDDYEIHTCRLILDEIFGEENRLGTVVIVHNPRGRNDDRYFATMHEYALFYAKNKNLAEVKKFEFNEEALLSQFPHKDEISNYGVVSYMRTGNNSDRNTRPNLYYPIYARNGELSLKKERGSIEIFPINVRGEEKTWRWSKGTFLEKYRTDILLKESGGKLRLFKKRRPEIVGGTKPKTIWFDPKYDASSHGVVLLDSLFNKRGVFPYPKSLYAVIDTLKIVSEKDSIILDFFAGSGTTGHAVLELNKEDGGNRKFILCTNNENNIATDVCYPRVAKVIEGYTNSKDKQVSSLGSSLKYFKTVFVSAEQNDKNKEALTKQATEMLCMREDAFDQVKETKSLKIFKNTKQYVGIVFDENSIAVLKKDIVKLGGQWSIYIFSLSDETFEEEFGEIKQKIKVSPIPEAILRVYRRLFQI